MARLSPLDSAALSYVLRQADQADHMRTRHYPTETIVSKKARKHYRIPVRSQYVFRWPDPRL